MIFKTKEISCECDFVIGMMKIKNLDESHSNLIKIDTILNLFINNQKIYIMTEKENFEYEFENFKTALSNYNNIQKSFIGYYNYNLKNELPDLNKIEG